MRLIDVDAAIDALSVASRGDSKDVIRNLVIRFLLALPTVDAEPVRHGKWIYTGQKNIYGGVGLKCSECGDNVMVQHIEDELYCRHCGAKMVQKGKKNDLQSMGMSRSGI